MYYKLFSFLLFLFCIESCAESSDGKTIAETKWILESMEGGNVEGRGEAPVSISFDEKEKRVNGKASCNVFFATYSIEDKQLCISQICATRMSCPQLAEEQRYLEMLETVNSYKIENTHLYLMKDGRILMQYVAEKQP